MAEATALSLSRFFSELTGKHVSFSMAANSTLPKGVQMYGLYQVAAESRPLLLSMHLSSLALLGGALMGIPADLAIERAQSVQIDEPLRDAMHEVLNIASTAFSPDKRIVFVEMSKTVEALPPAAKTLLKTSTHKVVYRVAVESSTAEVLTLAH